CLYAQPAALVPLALQDLSLPRGDGRPRVNPHAGLPAAIGLDGVDDVLEAVRQLRGEAVRQVDGARVALVASSPLEPTSAALRGGRAPVALCPPPPAGTRVRGRCGVGGVRAGGEPLDRLTIGHYMLRRWSL